MNKIKDLQERGLPIQIIAEALHVNRALVYDFMKGKDIPESTVSRLDTLYALFDGWVNLKQYYRLLNRPIEGNTLSELIKQDELDIEKISNLLGMLDSIAACYQRNEDDRFKRSSTIYYSFFEAFIK